MAKCEKEKLLVQAVVVVDDFEDSLSPLTNSRSKGVIPILCRPLIDFTLRLLQVNDVQEVFICCTSFHETIVNHVKKNWSGLSMDVQVTVSETYTSVGDVLRDLDRQAKIKGDFILIRGDVVGNINLTHIMEEHKQRKKQDKGSVMTAIYQRIEAGEEEVDSPCIARNRDNKILFYSKDVLRKKTLKIPLQVFKENMVVKIEKHIQETHVAICSISLLMLFTDNVDHQTTDDFIRGTLDNEDILGNSMYVHMLEKGYTGRVTDSFHYDRVSQELLSRWNHPFVPDKMDNFSFARNNIFLERNSEGNPITLSDAVLERNCLIGEGSCIGSGVEMTHTVIGRNCKVGKNATLNRCYVFDGVRIEDDCYLSHCIIDDDVVIKSKSSIKRGCILERGVVVGPSACLFGVCVRSLKPNETGEKGLLGQEARAVVCKRITHIDENDSWGRKDIKKDMIGESDVSPSESEADDLDDEEDYVRTFYSEVMDNFKRGVSENISCDNLILEVNSMKHAYNIPINEVTTLIVQAMIDVSDSVPSLNGSLAVKIMSVLKFLLPLIKNYVRDESSQSDCLLALEEFYLFNKDTFNASLLVKVIKYLYDEDVLEEEVVVEWFREPDSGSLCGLIHKEKEGDDDSLLFKKRVSLRKEPLIMKLIQWLEEADEESSSDDD